MSRKQAGTRASMPACIGSWPLSVFFYMLFPDLRKRDSALPSLLRTNETFPSRDMYCRLQDVEKNSFNRNPRTEQGVPTARLCVKAPGNNAETVYVTGASLNQQRLGSVVEHLDVIDLPPYLTVQKKGLSRRRQGFISKGPKDQINRRISYSFGALMSINVPNFPPSRRRRRLGLAARHVSGG